MFLACLKRQLDDVTAVEAIGWVRRHIRGAVETDEQEDYVKRFQAANVG
jgi:hypothetical protein